MDLNQYDKIIVAFSGGKDSMAAFLYLLDRNVPKSKIELWHHVIDGREGSTLMDWPCTESYCRKFAEYFRVSIYFSWRQGGFEREMTRQGAPTAPILFEAVENDSWVECGLEVLKTGGKGPLGTRMKFPQVSADLSVRWCSAYLKIDVYSAAIRNQERFNGKKTLVITGERADESPARAKYKVFEPDRTDNRGGRSRRWVDHWRSVHDWSEQEVWDIIARYKIVPHPAYRLGWGRLSCMKCIFGSANQWASIQEIDPEGFAKIAAYEDVFGTTIQRKESVRQLAGRGTPYALQPVQILWNALSWEYTLPIHTNNWKLPAGAFGENAGPT